MKIPLHAKVQCTDGPDGRAVRVIVNPITKKVTHVVVEERKLPHIERLVPFGAIVNTNDDLIYLDRTRKELSQMKPLIEAEFVWAEFPEYDESYAYLLHPYVIPVRLSANQKSLPPGDLCVRRGARVQATDGKVGWVDEFVVIPTNGEITHLLLREGHLWGCKEVTIPVSAIERIEERTVHLKLDKRGVQALPSVRVKRPWR
jgi:sporulation protein YlmC with PRC-barrel domain